MKKFKKKSVLPQIVIPRSRDVNEAIVNLELAIDKCLEDKHLYVEELSVALCRRYLENDKVERIYCHRVIFKHGPFNELKLHLQKDYFRPLDYEEMISQVMSTLASCNSFRFDFLKTKFVKKRILMG